jgi:hypothetical protein
MSKAISRRHLLASTPAVAAAVALPAAAIAAVAPHSIPSLDELRAAYRAIDPESQRFLRALGNEECDQELRRLYVERSLEVGPRAAGKSGAQCSGRQNSRGVS